MTRKLPESHSTDLAVINLSHLLARLENNLLSASADLKPLLQSQYHRARVGANLEYARTLLLQLERSLPNIKIQSRKHTLQTDLIKKRQQINILTERFDRIGVEAEANPQVFSDDEEDEEDILATPSTSSTGTRSPPLTQGRDQDSKGDEEEGSNEMRTRHDESSSEPALPPDRARSTEEAPGMTSTLRSRHSQPYTNTTTTTTSETVTATTTGSSFPSTSAQPTSPHAPRPPQTTGPSKLQTTEAALSQDRSEQETLTESLLTLATQLKTSSHTFHSTLEGEKSVLARAVEGLDRNTSGMEAAGKRMGMLRRMTEGKGWWGRIIMYLWIFGLWIVALLIVFVGPKLRF